jgi:uncharacterized protein DUF6611
MDCVRIVTGALTGCQSRCVTDGYHPTGPDFDTLDAFGQRSGTPRRRLAPRLRLARAWHRALDGEHVWGSIEIGLPSQGFRWYRLTVLPPGATATERRQVRLARSFPTWGAVMFVCLLAGLGDPLGPGLALVAAATLWLGAGILVFGRAADVRAQVRTVSVERIDRHDDAQAAGRLALLTAVVEQLTHADVLLAQGRLSVAQHELIWGLAHARLGPDQPDSVPSPDLAQEP